MKCGNVKAGEIILQNHSFGAKWCGKQGGWSIMVFVNTSGNAKETTGMARTSVVKSLFQGVAAGTPPSTRILTPHLRAQCGVGSTEHGQTDGDPRIGAQPMTLQ